MEHHPENVKLFYFLEILISTGEKEEKIKKRTDGTRDVGSILNAGLA